MSPVDHIMPISNTNYMDGMAKKKFQTLPKELLIDLYSTSYMRLFQ